MAKSPMMRRVGVVIAGALLSVGAGMVFPGAAQAARSDCTDESGWLCFWQHANFGGRFGHVVNSNTDWSYFNGGCDEADRRRWSNCASSIRNEGLHCEAVVYDGINMTGASWVINRDTEAADLADWGMPGGGNWNDKISSNSWWCG
ncbi:peptidase inhibitor family I36 protein [Paractinoplanes brasiliensis]|uniref:Peptidase inhibitor family I36 n=1 Tax=Paractinoplanes brasiliensis TaxID=52695 RepID=A0A4V6PST8_9ACTN|nr:peptidase inhibitor family I36 protein [Actinoplanes brasiliensis]TDO36928.1 peptidase inhibitor family I36 [Actinoplanes brasiliensis]GID30450.1 hypothetical protein Abr02nite_54330 [Actinoplanes brasiliensis]